MAEPCSIPREVLDFIDARIASVDQLEILLHMRLHRRRSWTAREISAALRSNENAALQRLSLMHELGLLELDGALSYRYAPADPEAARVVSLLASIYPDYRLRVIERIYTKGTGLSAFAEAFRLRKRGAG